MPNINPNLGAYITDYVLSKSPIWVALLVTTAASAYDANGAYQAGSELVDAGYSRVSVPMARTNNYQVSSTSVASFGVASAPYTVKSIGLCSSNTGEWFHAYDISDTYVDSGQKLIISSIVFNANNTV